MSSRPRTDSLSAPGSASAPGTASVTGLPGSKPGPPRLAAILEAKRAEVEELRADTSWRRRERSRPRHDFKAALAGPGLAVIAEVKRSSPSTGTFATSGGAALDPRALRDAYLAAGVDALSILSDHHFGMSAAMFAELAADASVPVLRKDFTLSTEQIDQAVLLGADAVLLIAGILDAATLRRLGHHAADCGLSVLYEVHAEDELDLLPPDAAIVGINNRDLSSAGYATDLGFSARLAGRLPAGALKVAESGYENPGEVPAGFDAVLIGTGLIRVFLSGGSLAERVRGLKS